MDIRSRLLEAYSSGRPSNKRRLVVFWCPQMRALPRVRLYSLEISCKESYLPVPLKNWVTTTKVLSWLNGRKRRNPRSWKDAPVSSRPTISKATRVIVKERTRLGPSNMISRPTCTSLASRQSPRQSSKRGRKMFSGLSVRRRRSSTWSMNDWRQPSHAWVRVCHHVRDFCTTRLRKSACLLVRQALHLRLLVTHIR